MDATPAAPPRPPLTTARVLAAALTLADTIGIDALTMRRLGQALGVEAMSLYNHVANKDAILAGIVDLVVAEIALPVPAADWKAALRHRGVSAHAVLVRHPWAAGLLMSRANVGPAMLRYVDATLGTLRQAGFSVALADHAWNAMDSHIYGYTLQELNFPVEARDYPDTAAAHAPLLDGGDYPHLAELATSVMAGAYDGTHDVTFGLDLILDGLERLQDTA